ncbi:ABC transporter permease [Actinoplanes sp. RD1]|uniref:ABC transporter permease n=1 Tax=Actinoplanes sp. RD1 TaxID=3064538 RepID=UPI00274078A6|nr:ABC transporter permease [Actinoplanes sp. RD1]
MNVVDLLAVGTVGLRIRKMRAVLSALGIAVGIATMVVVTGIPASSERALMAELAALGPNLLQVTTAPRTGDEPARLPREAPAMVRRIGPVISVAAVANTNTVVRRNDRTDPRDGSGLTVLAAQPELLGTLEVSLLAGRLPDTFPTVVLGAVAAARLGIATLPPGPPPQVIIGDAWFSVVGILAPTTLSPEIDRSVLVSWTAAEKQLGFDGYPTVLYVRAEEPSVEAVRGVLPATVDPDNPANVQVSLPSDALAAKRSAERTFSVLFLGLALVALLVGGIGVANTMVISVLERRPEIGLRRALGANRGQIRAQFLTESVVLSGLGGLTGTALGIAATAAYAWQHDWPLVVPLSTVGAALGGAVLVGVIAGVYPSVRAARLTPTAALASV